jgi:8-oxo-dGTP diphosphatase
MNSAATHIAIAVVVSGSQVLIGRRPAGVPLAGLWEFPGGKINLDESAEEAVVRECHEETGLSVRDPQPWHQRKHTYDHGQVELHFFLCRVPELPSVPAPWRWVKASELGAYPFPEANREVLEWLKQGKLSQSS